MALTLLAIILSLSAWHHFVVLPSIHASNKPAEVETEQLRQLRETKEELERIVNAARSSAPSSAGGKPNGVDDRAEPTRQ